MTGVALPRLLQEIAHDQVVWKEMRFSEFSYERTYEVLEGSWVPGVFRDARQVVLDVPLVPPNANPFLRGNEISEFADRRGKAAVAILVAKWRRAQINYLVRRTPDLPGNREGILAIAEHSVRSAEAIFAATFGV